MKSKFNKTLLFLALGVAQFGVGQQSATDSLKREIQVVKSDTAKANLYNRIATQFASAYPDSTAFYADMALSLATKIDYKFAVANAQINSGNVALITGKYDDAMTYYAKAKNVFSILLKGDATDKAFKNGLARAYASMGIVYSQQSNHYMALEQNQKALKLYQEIGQKVNISKALNNIGIIYKAQQNYPKALEYLKAANSIQREIGEQNEGITLTNIGVIYFETNRDKQAIEFYNKAKTLFEGNGNKYGLALVSNYLGDYYGRKLNPTLALTFYQKSFDLYDSMQDKFGASLALYNIGRLYCDQKKYVEAMPFANKSLAYAQMIGVLDQTYHSEKLLSDLYGFLGNTSASFVHYKKYITARDSINNQEQNKKFALSEMNFKYKQKEALFQEKNKRQNQLMIFAILGALLVIGLILVIYNRMQVKRRLTLQKEVAEYEQKALHLQMNPHFVFNCLGAISSFIVQNGTDSALKYLSKFSKLMRLTLEYSKGSLIPIDKEIESLKNYLELEQLRFNNKFDFSIESSAKIEFNMGLPPLLIQPFVENAILHGIVPKESQGRIAVNFDVENGQLICTVTDDGIGLAESKILKQNSLTAHKSMALEITRKRLEIMESITSKSAQIEIASLENQCGTRVTLRLPIQYIQ